MPIAISERRVADRTPASGRVEISFADPNSCIIMADLLETSATGFRIAHESKDVIPGLEVQVRREQLTQRARVVWTHLLEGRRVSGCVLL
jgi:hypothetical protein